MKHMYFRPLLLALLFFIVPCSALNAMTWIEMDSVTVCPAKNSDIAPPDFSSQACNRAKALSLDPQNRLIWVEATIILDEVTGEKGEPLALFVSGKMSSEVYLNGEFIGRNGTPGDSAGTEIAGLMDVALYPPQSLFKKGRNVLVLKASSHHSFLKLENPVHILAIGTSGNLTDGLLVHYWPSLVTLGLFILGAIYFGITGLIGTNPKRALTFSLIALFAAGQLVSEVSRGIYAYAYPLHDIRLLLITICSAGFGLAVAYHAFSTFLGRLVPHLTTLLFMICLVGVFWASGYDSKAQLAMLLPLTVSLFATGVWSYQRKPRAFGYFLSLLVFISAILIFRSLFLDVIFFYLVAAFLLFLFIEQGFVLMKETRERAAEAARANRLELALDQASERDLASEICIKSAGKMERISTDQIGYCKGASGYSEIVLLDGREILHSATLAELEDTLPSTFLRVHRSYLVNTIFVKSLEREPSGTGTLFMSNGAAVPISRRTMPHVRQALN